MFEGPVSELFRGVVVSSDINTGEVVVNLPSVLGQHGAVPVDIINKQRYDGLYEVPDPGTQVIVGTEDREFGHAFLVQVDPGSVRKSPGWDGVLTNGVITTPGTQGWVIDGMGSVEFHDALIRGDLEVGTTVGGEEILTPGDVYVTGTTNISGGRIRTGRIESQNFTWDGASTFSTTGTRIDLDTGSIVSPGLRVIADATPTLATFSGSVILGVAPNQLTITPADGMDIPLGEDGASKISWRSSGGTEVSFLRTHYSTTDNSSITELWSRSLGGGLVIAEVGAGDPIYTAGNRLDINADGDDGVLRLIGGGGWSRIILGPKGKLSDGSLVPAAAYWESLTDIWLAPQGSGGHVVIRRRTTMNQDTAAQLWLGPWVTNDTYTGMFNGRGATGNYIIMSDLNNTFVSSPASTGSVYLRSGLNGTTSEVILAQNGTLTLGASTIAVRNGTALSGDLGVGGSGRIYGGVGRVAFNDVRYYSLDDTNHRTFYDSNTNLGHNGPATIGWATVREILAINTNFYTQLCRGANTAEGHLYLYNGGSWWGLRGFISSSSENLKTNIQTLPPMLDKVRRVRPVSFKRKVDDPRLAKRQELEDLRATINDKRRVRGAPEADVLALEALEAQEAKLAADLAVIEADWAATPEPDTEMGFVAEELQAIDPGLVIAAPREGESMGVSLERMVAVLYRAVQELDAKVSAMPGGRP